MRIDIQHIMFYVFLIFGVAMVFAQNNEAEYNYANGNGTILSQFIEYGNQITIRKHKQRFSIYPYGEIIAYECPNINSSELFRLKNRNFVNSIEIAFIQNLEDANKSSSWIKIRDDDNRIGWLIMDHIGDLYRDGYWSILESIIVNGRDWTIRKLYGSMGTGEVLNVRDNPGINGTSVLFQIIPTYQNPDVFVTILAITEETDTIDGRTSYWVKIKDEQNKIGWVFGGYAGSYRGGPIFRIPEEEIYFNFNLP